MSASFQSAHQGVLLKTQHFETCVRFYEGFLGLPVWWVKPDICCLRFGSGYLMVERLGVAASAAKSVAHNPTVVRFHVPDIEAASARLHARGVAVRVQSFDWGTIAAFVDPDGNPCELAEVWPEA